MNTWTCKGPVLALLCLSLAACEAGQGQTGAPMRQARMMSGAVTLVAPQGYCIDPRSLRPAFALMARCDTLGAEGFASDAPLGLITASLAKADGGQPLPTAEDLAAVSSATKVMDRVDGDQQVLLQVEGKAPIPGLSGRQWRGAARIEGHLAAVAVYGPAGSSATGRDGGRILDRLIRGTREQTRARAAAQAGAKQDTVPKKAPADSIGGLSD